MNEKWMLSNQTLQDFCIVLLVFAVGAVFRINSQRTPAGTSEVRGSVFVRIPWQKSKRGRQVFLPDITVYVKNGSTSTISPKVQTDVLGVFDIPQMPAGTYQLCYEAEGYVPNCVKESLVIENQPILPSPIEVIPKPGFITGRVALKDDRPAFYQDVAFDIDAQTKVTLMDGSNKAVTKPVRTNVSGEFLIPNVTSTGDLKIKAEYEAAVVEKNVAPVDIRRASDTGEVLQLVLPNSSPKIKSVFATSNGQFVRQVPPGATVEVTAAAEDMDKDPLHYMWLPDSVSPGFISRDSRDIRWTLPKSSGLHSMYVLVKDSKGGYAFGRVDLSTSGPEAVFSGRVTADDASALQGVVVSVNNLTTRTNAEGYFFLQLPKESTAYILNVTKEGYALYSRILPAPAVGLNISVAKAQTMTIEPNKPLTFVEDLEQKGGDGVQVNLAANARVIRNGRRASAPLLFSATTIDLRDLKGYIPGGLNAVTGSGRVARLVSYGMVDVQAGDSSGNAYDLAPGQTATIRIPIDAKKFAAGPPATAGLWVYDRKAGVWREEGTANLVGDAYEGKVKRFSVVSVGMAQTDVACMRVHVDPGLSLPFNLRVLTPKENPTENPEDNFDVVTQPIIEAESVVFPLKPNEPITLQVLGSDGNPIELATKTINSGLALTGVDTSKPPAPPFLQCGSDAYLSVAPPDGGFLNYSFKTVDAVAANLYYAAIDESGVDRSTLEAWKRVNGFDSGDDASAVYFNNGDLGFGRGMHMKRRVVDGQTYIAYYVSNYPNVEAARLGRNLIATVAMEYSPGPLGGAPITKFYVFGKDDTRVNNADLDGRGPKFIPGLCMVCHGGNSLATGAGIANLGAKFIAFDLESFHYSGFDPTFSRASQEVKFKLLNRGILDTNVTNTNRQVIEGWYGGPAFPDASANDRFFPPEWGGHEELYSTIVKTSCRSCHLNLSDQNKSWASFQQFNVNADAIFGRVCGRVKVMPNAKQTYINFWASGNPHRPKVLGDFLDSSTGDEGGCPP